MGVYNPSLAQTFQKPVGISKSLPTDARSYYYDETLFKWRPYQNVAEALFYLQNPITRAGHFLVLVNEGGTLSGSTFTGGVVKPYWFKNGVADTDLVPFQTNITVNHIGPDETGNIQIDTGGVNGTPYQLPIATNSTLGGVIVTGQKGITIDPITGELGSNIPSFMPRSVPFAKGDGTLTEDNGGLFYNGTDLTAGHNITIGWSGVGLNGNRAGVYGSGDGMLLRLGDSSTANLDLDKSFQFYNGATQYLSISTTGDSADLSTYKSVALFSANVIPSIDLTYSLGSPDLRWLGLFADTITSTTIVTDSLTANTVTTNQLFAQDITTNTLTANSITTDSLTANTANITNLTSDTITTNTLNATTVNSDTVNTQNLYADNATITNLTATNANITNLTADTITTNVLNATTANIDTINSTTINNAGDINTQNLNATNITTTNLTAQNITANSITTNTLNATDINTTNLTTKNLYSENIYNSGDIITNHLTATTIDATTINLGGNSLTNVINNIAKTPYGQINQVQFADEDNSKDYYTGDLVAVGNFVTTPEELEAAKGVFVGFDDIFSTWKRFSHGTANMETSPTVTTIPDIPSETNAWSYELANDRIKSLTNSDSFIGFVSPEKYGKYTHAVTLSAQNGTESFNDNDFVIIVIAYVEDAHDLVDNNAAGLNPADFDWNIDTTSAKIPNQHTLSLVRGRTAQQPYNITETIRYAIVYNLGKPDQQVMVNGESQVWLTEDNYDSGNSCDVRVERDGDIIKTYTTNWNDAPGGKGILGHELTLDLSAFPLMEKFRGAASYGYAALSQRDSYFSNVYFSPNINTIYDVTNGDKWVANSQGVYSKDTTTYYDDFGVRRILYNETTQKLIYVKPDKSFDVINSGTGTDLNAITDITEPVPNTLRVWKGDTDYFDIILDSGTGGTTGGAGGRFGIEDNISNVDRSVDMQGHDLDVEGLKMLYFKSDADDGSYSELYAEQGTISITSQSNGNDYSSFTLSPNGNHSWIIYKNLTQSNIYTHDEGIKIKQQVRNVSNDPNQTRISSFIFPNYAEADGQEIIHYIPVSVNGTFAGPDGNITLADGGTGGGGGGDMLLANYIVDEPLSGTVNGTNTVFTFANAVVTNKEMIFLNGAKQRRGVDYTMTNSTTATFTTAPTADGGTDYLDATYFKQ